MNVKDKKNKGLLKWRTWKIIIAWVLAFTVSFQSLTVSAREIIEPSENETKEQLAAEYAELLETVNETAKDDLSETDVQYSDQSLFESDTESAYQEETESVFQEEQQISADLYENGIIKIYNLRQLQAIGTGEPVRSSDMQETQFGVGTELVSEGKTITYSADASYRLMNEIALSSENIWTLPEGFTGSFTGTPVEDDVLYNQETDTVYIYNNYQLQLVASDNSAKEPIMSNDMIPEKVGVGQLLYKDGTSTDKSQAEAQEYLTYSKTHHYVLSPSFTEQMPELLAETVVPGVQWLEGEEASGRSQPGQLTYDIAGETYILIGNETQLRAIGKDIFVTPRLYIFHKPSVIGSALVDPYYIPYYPGDADLGLQTVAKQSATTHWDGLIPPREVMDKIKGNEYTYYKHHPGKINDLAGLDVSNPGLLGSLLEGLGGIVGNLVGGENKLCGVNAEGLPDYKTMGKDELARLYGGLKYTADANYIIFRDIDLSANGIHSDKKDTPWEPLHFSGKIEGRLNMQADRQPTIKNIHVEQTGLLNMETTSGIGFFGTISNKLDENTLHSAGTVVVKNIHLDEVSVNNVSDQVDGNVDSIVEGLLGVLGGLLEGLLDLPIIGDLKLGQVIHDLLTLKQESPDLFATGSFAGRIVGDVRVENCTVTQASVTSARGLSGGFVGFTDGVEKYDGLSKILKVAIKALSILLNIVPAVGLGDLITILLKNDLSLDQLIPIGYYKPVIANCHVTLKNGVIGNATQDYNGGFVGIQTGTNISDSSVSGLTSVQAQNGAGGFAGLETDGVIKGLLNSVGVTLYDLDAKSCQERCKVEGQSLVINAANLYAGGFNGAMANSISSQSSVNGILKVKACKYAGGFSGRATIGFGTTLGGNNVNRPTIVESVSKLLKEVLASGKDSLKTTLLTLAGVIPSEIHGCVVQGDKAGLTVESTEDYAGGMIGQGDGVKITDKADEGITFGGKITGLYEVKATRYAGGVAGSVVTADVIGLLNQTIGIGEFIPFKLSQIFVDGTNWTVTATEKYAAGACGLMLGGTAETVEIRGIDKIQAGNYTGGFAGRTGASSLASAGGLNVLGLVKLNNVLSLANGVYVTINNCKIVGAKNGLTVLSDGTAVLTDGEDFIAGGFIGESVASVVKASHVENVKSVVAKHDETKASYAGGFIGRSHTGGLAGLADKNTDGSLKPFPDIIKVDSLLNAVPYLIPKYINTTVTFMGNGDYPQVEGKLAGGFAGAMQSGKVDNKTSPEAFAVYGLEKVKGESHAGGFAGKVDAGATAASDGLSLLNGILKLNITNLVDVLQVYIPNIQSAGVKSAPQGFTVEATDTDSYAGGYIGYGGGVQIKDSDVTSLKHTKVEPPSDSLESTDGKSYFSGNSKYAVKGGKYAGGYAGCVNIDSAAAVGGGLNLLDNIQLNSILKVLNVVCSTITRSDVNGCVGGYSVLADGSDANNKNLGKAGGFIGEMSGTIIKDSDANLFAYIIGREAAGGYVGIMEPGNVAAVLKSTSVLDGLLNITDGLANLLQSFIPIIEDSQTSSVPCGGAVRAENLTDSQCVRGLAGGYVGYNHGGRILGNASADGKECAAIRIRSVYGAEFSGGFTGLMETADLTDTGNLNFLFGFLQTSNVLSLLGAVYPTETNTAVYGPLRKVDMDTWNKWVEEVGSNGVYGDQFPNKPVATESELQALIKQYAYGYNVKAGRAAVGTQDMEAGVAGGYVGRMKAGVVTNAHAWDAKNVIAYTSAGGFAGEMLTGGVAKVGQLSLLGLNITNSIGAVQTFVPVIRNSDITGFRSGMTVKASGIPVKSSTLKIEKVGYAGGYVGHMVGGQVWGNWQTVANYSATDAVPDPNNHRCFVDNLRKVEGTKAVGGFAGQIDPASAASLDTASSSGLLGGLLQNLIKTPGDLLSLLKATIATVHGADVSAWDDWGIVINGAYTDDTGNTAYAKAAGGFAGEINGAVIGELNRPNNGVHVSNVRNVTGGEYAGGFFGLADVSSVAQISDNGNTSILASILKPGETDVMDAFRTYIYDSDVSGSVSVGLEIQARDGKKYEYKNDPVYSGNAGGFGGALLNGSVKGSEVTNLRKVNGLNYAGGFIGHMGKSGTVDLDNLGALGELLSAGAGVMDIFGSHADHCTVTGVKEGFTVHSDNTIDRQNKSEIAGGFTGYSNLGRMSGNTVTGLKQVTSGQIAGGFAGKTNFAYFANISLDSNLVKGLVGAVNDILKKLWIGDLQKGDVIKINLGIIEINALYDGKLVSLNLFGLDIKVGLAEDKSLATIYIGDSEIKINCSDGGTIDQTALSNEINISLIKANRTRLDFCTVTGVKEGYDVYGGGAGNNTNGTGEYGIAGGFVGWNNEGLFKNNNMYYADVIRGAKGLTGPFTGKASLKSNWEFNDIVGIEGDENRYRIYRHGKTNYEDLFGQSHEQLDEGHDATGEWKNIFTIRHMTKDKVEKFKDLKDAIMGNPNSSAAEPANVYMEDGAMAVLMDNIPTNPVEPESPEPEPDVQDPCKDLIELRIKKVWKGDDEKDRPNQIVFHITRSYEVNGKVIADEIFNKEVILKKEDAQTSDIWEKVLSGPEFTAYHGGKDGEKYYYTYKISETKVDGYETTITYQGDYHYSITITNKKKWFDSLLPETGGMGTAVLYTVGVLLLCFVTVTGYKKRKSKRRQSSYR